MPAPTTLPVTTNDPIAAAVAALKATPRAIFTPWATGVRIIWKNPAGLTAQQVLTGYGTYAAALMASSAALATVFLTYGEPALVAEVNAILALVKPFTVNDDGTVTVNP